MTEALERAGGEGFRVGDVFGRSFGVFSRHFLPFCLLGAVQALPYLRPTDHGRAAGWVPLLVFLLTPVTQAVVLYGAFQDMRGRSFGIGQSLKRGLTRFLPIVGLTICWGLTLAVGFLLLAVPALVFATMFYVALPACVVEKLGPFDSMSRSAGLTQGHRWKIFAVALVLFLVNVVVSRALPAALASFAGVISPVIGSFIWQAVLGAYGSIVVAVVYSDLRVAREGIDLEQIAAVFD